MPTTVISTLRNGVTEAGVFPTIEAWRSSLPANFVTADVVHILEVEANVGGHAMTANLTFSGITTDATRYPHIRPKDGHGHTGVWDTSKVMFTGTNSAANTGLLTGNTSTFIFEGLQVDAVIGSSTSAAIETFVSGRGTVHACIVRATLLNTGITGSRGIWLVSSGIGLSLAVNCIVMDCTSSSLPGSTAYRGILHTAGSAYAYNCTVVNCGGGIFSLNPGASAPLTLRNNLVTNSGVAGRVAYTVDTATLGTTSSHNAASDATAPGTSSRQSQVFVFKNAAANNYKLAGTDTGAKGFGVDLSADSIYPFSTDAGGQTRASPWDMGSDELDPAQSLTVTNPLANRVHQRLSGVATATVSGTYTGTPSALKARLLNEASTVVSGFDFATVVSSPSGNAFTFNLSNIPAALQWYRVEVQFTDDPAATGLSPEFSVGELIGVAGQSNAEGFFGGTAQTGNSNAYVRQTDKTTTGWSRPVAAGAVGIGNDLVTQIALPVGLINVAVSGTSIPSWIPGGVNYISALAEFNADGGKLGAIIWVQGENEATGTMDYAAYLVKLGEVFDTGFRTSLGQTTLPVIMVPLGVYNDGGTTATATYDGVRRAQHEWGEGNVNNYIVERITCEVPSGSIHLSATATGGSNNLGKRCAKAIAVSKGVGTKWRGPIWGKINRVSSTVYDINITHGDGADFTPASGITGLTVTDPGASNAVIAVSSAVRQSATVIRVTLAAAPVATHPLFSYLLTSTPNLAGVVVDNSSLVLALAWQFGKLSRTVATTLSLTLTTDGTTPAASQTGLRWALFKQVTPDQFAAPAVKGVGETTNASGVLDIPITDADMDAGSMCWLIVTNSDGTTTQSPAAKAFSGPVTVA